MYDETERLLHEHRSTGLYRFRGESEQSMVYVVVIDVAGAYRLCSQVIAELGQLAR